MDPRNSIAKHLEYATLNFMLHSEGLCPGTEGVLGTVLPWLLYPLLCIDLSGEVELFEGLGFSRQIFAV